MILTIWDKFEIISRPRHRSILTGYTAVAIERSFPATRVCASLNCNFYFIFSSRPIDPLASFFRRLSIPSLTITQTSRPEWRRGLRRAKSREPRTRKSAHFLPIDRANRRRRVVPNSSHISLSLSPSLWLSHCIQYRQGRRPDKGSGLKWTTILIPAKTFFHARPKIGENCSILVDSQNRPI